jgi:HD-GYP domain-containing protein (c-di-GMP phosphodiesterase class II)
MSRYCGLLARAFGLDEAELRMAGSMHDVGKVGLPDAILMKAGRLTHEERVVMERHTTIGHELLSGSGSPLLDLAAEIALSHHERWDGGGYPNGLRRGEICIEARIAAAVDVFDAVTTPRVYRPQVLSASEALAYLWQERGAHLDPSVVDAMLAMEGTLKDIWEGVSPVDSRLAAAAIEAA